MMWRKCKNCNLEIGCDYQSLQSKLGRLSYKRTALRSEKLHQHWVLLEQ